MEVAAIEDLDLVIIDTPPGIEDHAESTRLLIKRADLVLGRVCKGSLVEEVA